MASSPLRSKSHYHVRSISLPSRSHPLIPQFNEHLCRLRSSEGTYTSLPSLRNRASGLEDLYDCVADLLLLPHTQQALAHEGHKKLVDGALDGYLKLLDACATTKDIFSQTKEDVKELVSSLRRKRNAVNVGEFLASRKKVQKVIKKLVKDLKSIRNEDLLSDTDQEAVAIVSLLKEVEAVTLAVLSSFLSYAAGTKPESRQNGWSLVSKLMHWKNEACQSKEIALTEFQEVDAAVQSLIVSSKSDDKRTIEVVQQIGKLELSIQGLEENLERLMRHLIKTRVSLLNILNH
ncbi:uncharacterized protein LOC127802468 [Diospyros lotus]|uniref:uncharacterized protein LOC127802468 n=1 Tax=Diospyros lotus TaxID=55363 RepID=UPI00225A8997|nr:uncharacterized protein LOC127802468 [Diospyros lotus]